MAKIVFQGINSDERQLILSGMQRRVLGSQKMWCEIDNERGLIEFTVHKSEVPAEYQARTIDMVMTDFCNTVGLGSFMSRCYLNHEDRLEHFVEAIKNNETFDF